MNKSRRHSVVVVLLTGVLALAIGLLYSKGSADLSQQDRQPIAFSHEVHAGQLALDCLYCHRYAPQSTTAGIPSLRLCMGCHQNIGATDDDRKALLRHWEEQQPIAWVRLQRLPDFVYFTHERHLAHGLQCRTCHGEVQRMADTPRAATYEMGWCLSCHQATGASRDCWTCHK